MVRLGRLALAGVIAALAGQQARAGNWLDNLSQPEPVSLSASEPTPLGTGWYLRGDVGAGFDAISNFSSKPELSSWSVDLGAGYRLNNWFRADLTLNMRKPQSNTSSTLVDAGGNPITCLTGSASRTALTVVQDKAGNPLGLLFDPTNGTCRKDSSNSLRAMTAMINGYIDLGTWSGFTPYVGAGIGVAQLNSTAGLNFYNTANGGLYAPTAADWQYSGVVPYVWLDAAGNVVHPTNPDGTPLSITTPPAWNKNVRSTKYNFAWALMGGVSYDVSANIKVDVGFRYMNLGSYQLVRGLSNLGTAAVSSKEVKVGFRYMID